MNSLQLTRSNELATTNSLIVRVQRPPNTALRRRAALRLYFVSDLHVAPTPVGEFRRSSGILMLLCVLRVPRRRRAEDDRN